MLKSFAGIRKLLPLELTWIPQGRIIEQEQIWYVQPDGKLNMLKLLGAFQQFFRENSAIWVEQLSYKEAAPYHPEIKLSRVSELMSQRPG